MRIVEEWSHEKMRLTIMIMNGRYSLKVEQNLLEQTYKFRDGQINNPAELKNLLSQDFYKACSNSFIHMDLNRSKITSKDDEDEQFIELI